ncbi:MAG TPA: hypothetical protein PKH39_04505 [Woeseiaceae bacterium]|nr:hypothetical protein [Woeseiaceae bacterium]
MNKLAFVLTTIAITALLSSGVVLANEAAIKTMARITMNLNHFPSDEDKATLKGIIDSDESSEEAADIALAISNMEHKVLDEDIERLQDIISDNRTAADARTLASILLRINHAASDEDKKALAALAGS